MNNATIINVSMLAAALAALAVFIILVIKNIWLPYSKYLIFLAGFWILANILFLFNMPKWINNIWFGIGFLVFPILDGVTTRIALTKFGGSEANPIMAWVIKKLGINVSAFIPFLFFSIVVWLFWKQSDSSTLFAIIICYLAVVINNLIVIKMGKRRLSNA